MALDAEKIDGFLSRVKEMVIRKAELYDGFNSTLGDQAVKKHLFSCVEELGEVSSAYTRNRLELAKQECVDVMHSAMNLYIAIENEQNESHK